MDGPKLTLIPIEDIQTEVGKFYNVTVKEIKATKRTQNIVLARQVAMYLAREKSYFWFCYRHDHSTVLHAYNKIKNMISQDDSLRIEIDTIKNKIKWPLWISRQKNSEFSTTCAQVLYLAKSMNFELMHSVHKTYYYY